MLRVAYIKMLYFTQFKEIFTGVNVMEIFNGFVIIQ